MELKMLRVDATKSRNQAKKELDEVGEMFLDSWLMFCPWSPIQHHFFFGNQLYSTTDNSTHALGPKMWRTNNTL